MLEGNFAWAAVKLTIWTHKITCLHEDINPLQLDHLENSIKRGTPLGHPDWNERSAEKMKLQSTLRNDRMG
jgi:hypothetical protein